MPRQRVHQAQSAFGIEPNQLLHVVRIDPAVESEFPQALVMMDGHGLIRRVNRLAENLFGYSCETCGAIAAPQMVKIMVPSAR